MIDKETYNKYTIWQKIVLSVKTLSLERAFFAGIYVMLGLLFLFMSLLYLLANKTVETPKYNTDINILCYYPYRTIYKWSHFCRFTKRKSRWEFFS